MIVREAGGGERLLVRDVSPLEGTNISLWSTIIPTWWAQTGLSTSQQWVPGDGDLADKVWVANRCIQLNAQQIAAMPLRFEAPPSITPPAWLSSPDPHWFPNGISDALFAIIAQLYGWGYACLYITNHYSDGYPRNWTVLDSSRLHISGRGGNRSYKVGDQPLNPNLIVQIDRNPSPARSKGTSAIAAYAQQAWSLLAAGNQSMDVSQGGVPKAVLKSSRKLQKGQAEALQEQWMTRVQARNGAPPVLPPELDFKTLSFSPKDLALLETQEWNAQMIATAMGVPSVLVNMALQGGLTYQNPAALGEMWWRFELRTTAKRVADAFTAQLLPAGQWVWFDASDTFLPLTSTSEKDDPQAAQTNPNQPPSATAQASPGAKPQLAAVTTGGTP